MKFSSTEWIYLLIAKVIYSMDLSVIPECYIDTNLVESLVPPKKGYNHQKGCGTVAKVMREHFGDTFAVGIVDKDKKELDYLKEFSIITAKGNIELQKHSNRNHFIIRIAPAMEQFLLSNIDLAGINLEDFDLPSEFDKFRKATKTVNSKKDVRFKRLFKVMREHNLPDFELLTNWLGYLINHPYDADIDVLKAM